MPQKLILLFLLIAVLIASEQLCCRERSFDICLVVYKPKIFQLKLEWMIYLVYCTSQDPAIFVWQIYLKVMAIRRK